ncbi:hypothetical protein K431DRAFT_288197 [Polychaeton citri CBS 116435]|uniref:PDZ GRASP-type domain-containing protein n=1 Tax=Polychaeton citri CBS 116435 TaxID=1314669 RepID=A0A9P4UKV9_9PEZI|nr:hypothetical protein K431DRAFT_288197 [Polychaeton citri CBS 116435]
MASMFGALNRFIARLDSDPNTNQKTTSGAYGFQVLRNTDANLALEPWFDFIIGINGRTIDSSDPNLFVQEVRNCAGSSVSLGVYSAKGQQIREMYASIPAETGNLSLTLQWTPLNAVDDVWHILDVMPNSPADEAGLLPYSDYVFGSPEGLLRGESGLGELVEDFTNRALRLYVYNNEYDLVRMVTITPQRGWGGDGSLGCVLGFGALHRIPAPLTEPSQGPGETLFETGLEQARPASAVPAESSTPANFLVPANLDMPATSASGKTPPPPSGPPSGRAKKPRAHHATPKDALNDYFKEGEETSRKLDGGSTPKPSGSLPPPPKGGPPKAASPAPAGDES